MPDFIGPLSHHIHETKPIPYSRAQKWMNAYTTRSNLNPHMHPDSQLSRRIDFGTNGARGGVTMSQLRKVAQGLGGERRTPEPEAVPEGKDRKFASAGGGGTKKTNGEKAVDKGTKESEWVDGDQFAVDRHGDELGEIGKPHNFVGVVKGGEVPEVDETSGNVDKEERKRLKKEKRKAEKHENSAKRQKTMGVED